MKVIELLIRSTSTDTCVPPHPPFGTATVTPGPIENPSVTFPDPIVTTGAVFRGSLDTSSIKIGKKGLTPFHTETTVNPFGIPWFPPRFYSDDFSKEPDKHLFIHELTHTLQHQQGNNNVLEFIKLLIKYKLDYDRAYEYDKADLGKMPLYKFNIGCSAGHDLILVEYCGLGFQRVVSRGRVA